jgi:hypothetical protein
MVPGASLLRGSVKLRAWDDGRFRDADGPTLAVYLSFVGDNVVEGMQAGSHPKSDPCLSLPCQKRTSTSNLG